METRARPRSAGDLPVWAVDLLVARSVESLHDAERAFVTEEAVRRRARERVEEAAEREDVAIVVPGPGDGGLVLVAAEFLNPWTGQREGFVHSVLSGSSSSPDAWGAALRSVEDVARARGWSLLRAELPAHPGAALVQERLLGCGWAVHALVPMIRATTGGAGEDAPLPMRWNRPEDRGFVLDLLWQAFLAALDPDELAAAGSAPARRRLEEDIAEGWRTGTTESVVAVGPGSRPVSHATIRLAGTHPRLGVEEAELLDVSTLPGHGGAGAGQALTAASIRRSAERGAEVVTSTVDMAHTPPDRLAWILPSLARQGWWQQATILRRPV